MNLRFIEIIRSNTLYVNWWKIVNLNNVYTQILTERVIGQL